MTHPLLKPKTIKPTMSNRQFFGFTTLISMLVAPAVGILWFFISHPLEGVLP